MRSQRLICEVNERMALSFARLALEDLKGFMCECGAASCTERIFLTLEEYRAVRSARGRLAIACGHPLGADERLVTANERFTVVQKAS